MRRMAVFLAAALMLAGCASEINKPIEPGDDWAEDAYAIDNSPVF